MVLDSCNGAAILSSVAAKSATGISILFVLKAHKRLPMSAFLVPVCWRACGGSSERRFLESGNAKLVRPAAQRLASLGGGYKPLLKEAVMATLYPVPVLGTNLQTTLNDNSVYVTLRSLCDALELNLTQQYKKLEKQKRKFSCTRMGITANDGKNYQMICIPVQRLDTWLFSINSAKIKDPNKRQRLEQFQDECSEVLYRHWHGSEELTPPRSPTEETLTTLRIMKSFAEGIDLEGIRNRLVDTIQREHLLLQLAERYQEDVNDAKQ